MKKAVVDGKPYTLFAHDGGTVANGGNSSRIREFMIFPSLDKVPGWVKRRKPMLKELPDEQSLLTFFPLDLLLGRSRHASRTLDEVTRGLREAGQTVLCFHPGCRQKAHYRATNPVGLEGGCWFACSREHFSRATTKGFSLRDEDYDDIGFDF